MTVNNLSTVWREQGDNPDQSPRVKQKNNSFFTGLTLCTYSLLRVFQNSLGKWHAHFVLQAT